MGVMRFCLELLGEWLKSWVSRIEDVKDSDSDLASPVLFMNLVRSPKLTAQAYAKVTIPMMLVLIESELSSHDKDGTQ